MSTPTTYKAAATDALLTCASAGGRFTADNVHALIPDHLTPQHRDALGPIFRSAARRGQITAVDYAPSTRPGRHGSVIRVYVAGPALTGAAA
ncbi:hypothetical protein O4215_20415 [Rhodococcus maanshanensis]|uniref:hypothetical protein n=1 Tax=Rhodococcus maanshanensis TaxID=183556 RepID=UPI0022B2FA03|nr:hypothetical protein [Rhodococcus maanshanensis]MCZ4557928.1 hypothetical protein [Rhodococcus maanshanensis]